MEPLEPDIWAPIVALLLISDELLLISNYTEVT